MKMNYFFQRVVQLVQIAKEDLVKEELKIMDIIGPHKEMMKTQMETQKQ
jgi:hypothetical protein